MQDGRQLSYIDLLLPTLPLCEGEGVNRPNGRAIRR